MRTFVLAAVVLSLFASLFASGPARATAPYQWTVTNGSPPINMSDLPWNNYASTCGLRPLMFSGCPYEVDNGSIGNGVLWHDGRMDGTEGYVTSAPEHVYLWHENHGSSQIIFALTITNNGSNAISVGGYYHVITSIADSIGNEQSAGEELAYYGIAGGASLDPHQRHHTGELHQASMERARQCRLPHGRGLQVRRQQ